MARFGSLGTQYFDNSGEPLVNGLIYFYESGTTTLKNTYADINETIPNTNPVVLTASGRQPNIFFSGSAKAVLATSDNVIIETRDPVGATVAAGEFGAWDTNTVYSISDIVTGSDGEYYVSIQNGNQGFDPTLEPAYWTQLDLIRVWNTNETYQIDDLVKGSDGIVYRGTSSNNAGNDPIADTTATDWIAAGVKLTIKGSILAGDGSKALPLAPGAEGTVPKIRAAAALGIAWEPESGRSIIKEERSSNTILSTSDSGKLIKITSGTFSQTFQPVATLTSGWFVYYQNAGTGLITLDPDATELIDGLSTYIMYPGEARLIQCDGTKLTTIVLNSFEYDFNSSGNFTKPPGYVGFSGYCWAGGGGGATGYGGGGGACVPFNLKNSMLADTVAMTIGAGGASGATGGNTSFGSLVVAYGGGGAATSNNGGGGGGMLSAGASTGVPGKPIRRFSDGSATYALDGDFGGGHGFVSLVSDSPSASIYGGGGGGNVAAASIYGGGGGGSTGGTSVYAGAGGNNGQDGNAPSGGGGTGTTSGGAGRVRIRGIF